MMKPSLRRYAYFASALLFPLIASAAQHRARPTAFRHAVALRQENTSTAPKPARSWTSARQKFNLQPAGYTPYDPYLGTIRRVFANVDGPRRSLSETCKLLRLARGFAYVRRDPYRADPPSVTAARKAGDCKAKALWLYDRLGDTSALYVIGKARSSSRTAHAWLYWRYDQRWWILDPTNLRAPIAADTVSSGRYIPYYSFSPAGAFRHPATHLLLYSQTGSAATVAERKR